MKRRHVIRELGNTLIKRRDMLRRVLYGELSQLGGHDDDETYEDDIYSELAVTEGRELKAIERAIDRMREGQYGVCEECGGMIPLSRLRALPYATFCIDCQRKSDIGWRVGGTRGSPGNAAGGMG
jgi:DnaK suppressor protein